MILRMLSYYLRLFPDSILKPLEPSLHLITQGIYQEPCFQRLAEQNVTGANNAARLTLLPSPHYERYKSIKEAKVLIQPLTFTTAVPTTNYKLKSRDIITSTNKQFIR